MRSLGLVIAVIFSIFFWLLFAQLDIDYTFSEAIATSNYYNLVVGVAIFAPIALLLCYHREFKVCLSDILVVAIAIFSIIHSRSGFHTKEVVMSLSYITLYISLRIVDSRLPNSQKLITVAIMIMGIYQSILVLKQVYGFEMANNYRFLVSGSFFNPGPCGIFIGGVMVLALTIIKHGIEESKLNVDTMRYYLAYATLASTLMAILPTLSRAGWIGAIVGVGALYHKEAWCYSIELSKRFAISRIFISSTIIISVIIAFVGIYLFKQDSANGRLFIWYNCIVASLESPIFGLGIGNFAEYYAEAQRLYFESYNTLVFDNQYTSVVGIPEYPFNEFVALFMALGSVGTISVFAILYLKLFCTSCRYKAVIISIITMSIFSYTFYIPLIAILLVFTLSDGNDRYVFANNRFINLSVAVLPLLLLSISLFNIRGYFNADREWREISLFYKMEDYETVVEESAQLFDKLKDNPKFLFEYGHSLSKIGKYELSNNTLIMGSHLSVDPMFWNMIGNNYVAMSEYVKAENSYLRAYYQSPNRLYPIYLLTKLCWISGDIDKMNYYGSILLSKEPKISSQAVDEMKQEVREILGR